MSKHEMHVEFTCRRCGKTETLIFLEPVNVDLIRQYVTPPDWGFADGGFVCKECLEVRGKWLQ